MLSWSGRNDGFLLSWHPSAGTTARGFDMLDFDGVHLRAVKLARVDALDIDLRL